MAQRENQNTLDSVQERLPYSIRELERNINQLEQSLNRACNYSELSKILNQITKYRKRLDEETKLFEGRKQFIEM